MALTADRRRRNYHGLDQAGEIFSNSKRNADAAFFFVFVSCPQLGLLIDIQLSMKSPSGNHDLPIRRYFQSFIRVLKIHLKMFAYWEIIVSCKYPHFTLKYAESTLSTYRTHLILDRQSRASEK